MVGIAEIDTIVNIKGECNNLLNRKNYIVLIQNDKHNALKIKINVF